MKFIKNLGIGLMPYLLIASFVIFIATMNSVYGYEDDPEPNSTLIIIIQTDDDGVTTETYCYFDGDIYICD